MLLEERSTKSALMSDPLLYIVPIAGYLIWSELWNLISCLRILWLAPVCLDIQKILHSINEGIISHMLMYIMSKIGQNIFEGLSALSILREWLASVKKNQSRMRPQAKIPTHFMPKTYIEKGLS